MAKEKPQKSKKKTGSSTEKKVPMEVAPRTAQRTALMQVRISENNHKLFSRMCAPTGQSVAQRLRSIIEREIEEHVPFALVNRENGTSLPTRLWMERVFLPDKDECSVRVYPEDAKGVFPEVFDQKFDIAIRLPNLKFFSVVSRYVDADGVWHLHMKRVKRAPA